MSNFLDFLRSQLSDQVAERIGNQIGLTPDHANNVFQSLMPLQLDALTSHAQTQSGAQQLLDLASSMPAGSVHELLERPGAFADLAKMGNTFAPVLLGNAEQTIASKVNEAIGVPASAVQNMGRLTLPLILSLLLQHVRSNNIAPAGLGSLLLSMRPTLQGMLPAGLASLLGGLSVPALAASLPTDHLHAGQVVDTVTTEPTVRVTEGSAVNISKEAKEEKGAERVVATPVGPERVVTGQKKDFPWWVLIPLLLLLALLLRTCAGQPEEAPVTHTPPAQTQTQPAGEAKAPTTDAGSVVVEKPEANSTIPAVAFTMQGKGKAGDKLSISDQGQHVADVTVGADGNWSTEIPAPTKGEHTYTVQGGDTNSKAEFKVNVGDTAANAQTAKGKSTEGTNTGAVGTLTITDPKDGGSTPGGAFDLKGTGKAGDEVEIFEDGTSLGKATVGTDGNWTLNVPAPTAGAHKYEVKGPETSVTSNVTVGALKATGEACAKDFTLSLKDGETVSAPFRFGGVGKGKSYTVTVKRGERVIGTKELPLDAGCGYSYTSNPGKAGDVTYVVSETGGADAGTITLHVK